MKPNDLKYLIQRYQSQPELLRLILASKTEEDKRRAEEAKLRTKELDLILPYKEHSAVLVMEEQRKSEDGLDMTRPRKKREMQAITKVVETRDFPYVDSYVWKNNGNTVQKKTGCKSVYYKCSNKGCPVNKTVIERPSGEYLIKYRGCHLTGCGTVERIRDL